MMNVRSLNLAVLAIVTAVGASASLPLPDAVIMGELRINGQLIPATRTDVQIIARRIVSGQPENEVGRYRMGERAPLGARYAVRIRMESLVDGSQASSDAVTVGRLVRLFVQEGSATPQAVPGDLLIGEPGPVLAVQINLGGRACPTDVDGNGQTDLVDLAILLTNFGLPTGASHAQGDVDEDSDVDLTDLANVLIVFGLPCS